MWFKQDEHTVHVEAFRTDAGADMEVAIRFGSLRNGCGPQEHNGKRGWFCAYVAMKDADFDRIRGKQPACPQGYPEIGAHGGTSYFNRAPPFEKDHDSDVTVIGWDYNHFEPSENGVTFDDVLRDAETVARFLSGLF